MEAPYEWSLRVKFLSLQPCFDWIICCHFMALLIRQWCPWFDVDSWIIEVQLRLLDNWIHSMTKHYVISLLAHNSTNTWQITDFNTEFSLISYYRFPRKFVLSLLPSHSDQLTLCYHIPYLQTSIDLWFIQSPSPNPWYVHDSKQKLCQIHDFIDWSSANFQQKFQ